MKPSVRSILLTVALVMAGWGNVGTRTPPGASVEG